MKEALRTLLQAMQWDDLALHEKQMDCSYHTSLAQSHRKNALVAYTQARAKLLALEIVTQEVFDQTITAMQEEMSQEDFQCTWRICELSATKPVNQ